MAGQGSLWLPGGSAGATSPFRSSFNLTGQAATVEFWLRTLEVAVGNYLFSVGQVVTSGYGVRTTAGNQLEFVWSSGAALVGGVDSGIAINDGAWHHYACVKSGAGTVCYRDGLRTAQATSGAGVALVAANAPAYIGWRGTSNSGIAGHLSEVRLWGTARDDAQVLSMWDARASGLESGLVAVWPLDDDAGLEARELVAGPAAALTGCGWLAPITMLTPAPPDGGGTEPTTPVLAGERAFVGSTLIDLGAYFYRLTVDTWPDAQPALAIPIGHWLPRLGWVAYVGADSSARQLTRLQFGVNELWPEKRPCAGLYVHVPAGVSGQVEAWNLV